MQTLLIGMGENHGLPYKLIGSTERYSREKMVLALSFNARWMVAIFAAWRRDFGILSACALCPMAASSRSKTIPTRCRVVDCCKLSWMATTASVPVRPGRQSSAASLERRVAGHAANGLRRGRSADRDVAVSPARLWVASWGDHRIERYQLAPRGSSYCALRDVIVQGGTDFRPTGMAIAPDGSLYFGDWVLSDYPVHGHGRIWRLTVPKGDATVPLPKVAAKSYGNTPLDFETSEKLLNSDDVFERTLAQQEGRAAKIRR